MVVETKENPLNCGSQNGKAKSRKGQIVARFARFVRQAGLSYDDWRYVARQVRRKCDLHPGKKPKKLPRVLTADQFRAFYRAVDQADDIQHALMLRLQKLEEAEYVRADKPFVGRRPKTTYFLTKKG
jgi:integrase